MTRRVTQNQISRRAMTLQVRSDSFDEEAGTIEVVYATDRPIGRGRIREVLSMEPGAIVTDRLDAGAVSLMRDHRTGGKGIGRVISHRVEGGSAIATIQLSEDPEHAGTIADIRSGVTRSVSVGFLPHEIEEREEAGIIIFDVRKWEPYEISLTVIPADVGAHIRSDGQIEDDEDIGEARSLMSRFRSMLDVFESRSDSAATEPETEDPAGEAPDDPDTTPETQESTREDDEMTEEQRQALLAEERQRVADIHAIASRHSLPEDFAAGHISAGADLATVQRDALEQLASRSAPDVSSVRVTRDERETLVMRASEALTSRMTGQEPSEAGREMRNFSTVDLAREFVGASARGMSASEVTREALSQRSGMHTTSDFSAALGSAADRTLRNAYTAAERSFGAFVRETTHRNFLGVERVAMGDAPQLKQRAEGAEVSHGTVSDSVERFKIATYDRALVITRQMLVNDDLGSFSRLAAMFGARSAELEADLVYEILTGNPKMADTKNLFSAGHSNTIGTALEAAAMATARAMMRKQKGLDGAKINVSPRTLIVGPDLQTDAEKILSPISATVAEDVNVFAGARIGLAVDSRIEGSEWYLAADPNLVDTIELAFLDGARGVQVSTLDDLERDAVKVIARLDVGAAPIDHRGLLRSTGA